MRCKNVLSVLIIIGLPILVNADSALQQLYDAAGKEPSNIPMPATPSGRYDGNAPSQNVQKSAPQKVNKAPSTSTMVGATVFGVLLEGIFMDSFNNQPDPEALARQAEQERKAQEEAIRKEKEAQARHNNLIRSFKATPSTSTTTETTSSSLAFKTAQSIENTPSKELSDEALREAASRSFDGGSKHTVFANHWKHVALSKTPVVVPEALPLCYNGKCTWPTKTVHVNTALPYAQVTTKTVHMSQLTMPSVPNSQEFISTIMGNTLSNKGAKNYLILTSLSYITREVGKELLSSIAMTFIESTPLGDKFSLVKDVYDLATDNMENAQKVAVWLGTTQLDNPPEITSLSEASKPFLLKAMGTAESLEDITELISDTNEVFGLSAKLSNILKEMP